MSQTGKQSPLGVNANGSILQDLGLNINPVAAAHFGASRINTEYSFGSLVQGTCLRLLTWAINDAYNRGVVSLSPSGTSVYDHMITIGQGTVPALGNSKPPTYILYDPSGRWAPTVPTDLPGTLGPATTGYSLAGNTGQGQSATWIPYLMTNDNNSVTQWGFIRCWALQAWNEFNWNGIPTSAVEYKDFTHSFLAGNSFVDYSNVAINAMQDGQTFLKGTYSNMDDLISADISGVSLSTSIFGQDCITAGKVVDLSKIATFGLPSVLLQTIKQYNATTQSLILALLSSGLSNTEIDEISRGVVPNVTKLQEQKIYGSFLIIVGPDLLEVLIPLNCKTSGLESLADLLNVKKIFPNSYRSLTVPLYNASLGPTNSKTYYPIFKSNSVNSGLTSPAVKTQVGTTVQPGEPLTTDSTISNLNFQVASEGFGSYLSGILPNDVAVTAGAFSASMQQIRNIHSTTFVKFAQVAYAIETTKGLTLVNGTDVPANLPLATAGHSLTARGSGIYGLYTMSDLFGCMSGLPYMWSGLQSSISSTQTYKLNNIYNQLFLAVTWEPAYCSVLQPWYYVETVPYIAPTYDPLPPYGELTPGQAAEYDWYYSLSFALAEQGGGYGRGTAVTPIVSIVPNNVGASCKATMGIDDQDAASMGGGTYGRVTSLASDFGTTYLFAHSVQNNFPAAPNTPPRPAMPSEVVTIQAPPTEQLYVQASGEIASTGVNTTGTAVWYSGSTPVSAWPAPMNTVVDNYIVDPTAGAAAVSANAEIAHIKTSNPNGALNLNLMYDSAGTQLTIEQRARYTAFSPVPSPTRDTWMTTYPTSLYVFMDSIPSLSKNTLPHMSAQTLEAISNMSMAGGQSIVAMMRQERNATRLQELGIDLDNNIPGEIDPTLERRLAANGTLPGARFGIPVRNLLWTPPSSLSQIDATDTLIYPMPFGYIKDDQFIVTNSTTTQSPLNGLINGGDQVGDPIATGPGTELDTGKAVEPGSLAGATPILPNTLTPPYTAGILLPSTYSVDEAIDEVIKCNCDCWFLGY